MTHKSRRRFVQLAGSALAVGLAGCSSQGGESEGDETTTTEEATETTSAATTTSQESTGAETTTEATTEDEHENENDSDHPDEHETPGEGEEEIHQHGTLYLEIDGERVDFSQEKFLDGPLEFHFHDDGKQYEWHNEKSYITLAEALNYIPDISYENSGSDHMLTVEGTTYDTTEGADITFAERDTEIDPTTYELEELDIYWVKVQTDASS
ncbi:hypothetical protein [Haladaptatus sp. CMSO5]|uniref:hypothetical protein n=1 Tax=Haladaptatus sp. CMSO5 TaxID=3120514 RepID=UPI002FCE08E6